MTPARQTRARELMEQFADRTGLGTGEAPRRYLWTDAFAVCNFLGLGDTVSALRLVDQVHRVLGHHRPDARGGWLTGASDLHPTLGGLRIGKPMPERRPGDAFDARLEWDRDGQYFHYLTRWMHALHQVGRVTGRASYTEWACELAKTAHDAFVLGERRMAWKMSVDLSRPLVASMGQHDPLDGFVTCTQLGLTELARSYTSMIDTDGLVTHDPLGIGGLLFDAYRLDQIGGHGRLRDRVLEAAVIGVRAFSEQPVVRTSASRRLAFRELGLAIGLAAPLADLAPHSTLRETIEAFWWRPEHRSVASWREHEDINDVMLATCLCPTGFARIT